MLENKTVCSSTLQFRYCLQRGMESLIWRETFILSVSLGKLPNVQIFLKGICQVHFNLCHHSPGCKMAYFHNWILENCNFAYGKQFDAKKTNEIWRVHLCVLYCNSKILRLVNAWSMQKVHTWQYGIIEPLNILKPILEGITDLISLEMTVAGFPGYH